MDKKLIATETGETKTKHKTKEVFSYFLNGQPHLIKKACPINEINNNSQNFQNFIQVNCDPLLES